MGEMLQHVILIPDGEKSTSNIAHLVKKRKKSDAEPSVEVSNGEAAKKPHVEEVTANGNGHVNGH
jgi:hypothetical protein